MKQARLFIVLAMVHFVIGVTLGGMMAVDTSLWGTLVPVHAELNPFGWLTMLIYGMTYAVLASFGRFRPLSAVAGWTHLLCAEIGVAAIALGAGFSLNVLVEAGWVFQALAPLLFLRNIMWIVRSGQSVADRPTGANSESSQDGSGASGLLTPAVYAESTDRIAQRGTSLALLCWIIAAVWMAADVLATAGADAANLPTGALVLVYYGWIAGTVLSVSLHLFPRFVGRKCVGRRQGSLIQALWIAGVAIAAIAPDPGSAAGRLGFALIGVSLLWISSLYVWQMRRDWFKRLGVTSGGAWLASWCFALALGVRLVWGADPLSLVSLHLLFLGWITTLVYGVGYTLFPRVLHRYVRSGWVSPTQMAASISGAVLMPIGFFLMARGLVGGLNVLAVGGVFAGLGALSFIVIWSASKREGGMA